MNESEQSFPHPDDRFLVRQILTALRHHNYRFASEAQLHDGIAGALSAVHIPILREFTLNGDRFDFLCANGIVIEAKIDGSLPAALRQVERYCAHKEVRAVIIAASNHWARIAQPELSLLGKPIHIVHLHRQAF